MGNLPFEGSCGIIQLGFRDKTILQYDKNNICKPERFNMNISNQRLITKKKLLKSRIQKFKK